MLTRHAKTTAFLNAPGTTLTAMQMVSPNQTSTLPLVTYSEFFAGEIAEVTRLGAMQIPPFKRGRDILVGVIASMNLREFAGDRETTPAWLRNTRSGVSPWHRMAATVDDLIFYDWSLWAVERGASGQITDAIHIPYDQWAVDDAGRVTVNGRVVSAEEVILIPGNGSGGVLMTGASTIKGYRALERSWIGRAQNPIPLVELHQTTDDQLTDGDADDEEGEIARLVSEWSAARTSPTGAVGYTPHNIEVRVHGTVETDLFVEGRNAAVLDVARLLNMPASLLDGSMSTASLTYVTTEGKRSEFAALTLPGWIAPIEARLSMDDVSPRGHVIRFDQSSLVEPEPNPINEPRED